VLTGDNELVTRHVFAEIGVPVTGVLTGDAPNAPFGRGADRATTRVNLFCRINPQQKLRVLLALKRLGHVVGFMGTASTMLRRCMRPMSEYRSMAPRMSPAPLRT